MTIDRTCGRCLYLAEWRALVLYATPLPQRRFFGLGGRAVGGRGDGFLVGQYGGPVGCAAEEWQSFDLSAAEPAAFGRGGHLRCQVDDEDRFDV